MTMGSELYQGINSIFKEMAILDEILIKEVFSKQIRLILISRKTDIDYALLQIKESNIHSSLCNIEEEIFPEVS